MTEVSEVLYTYADECGDSIRQIDETDQILPHINALVYWHPSNRHRLVYRILRDVTDANIRRYE